MITPRRDLKPDPAAHKPECVHCGVALRRNATRCQECLGKESTVADSCMWEFTDKAIRLARQRDPCFLDHPIRDGGGWRVGDAMVFFWDNEWIIHEARMTQDGLRYPKILTTRDQHEALVTFVELLAGP